MAYKIIRGRKIIGGTIVEVSYGDKRIWIDFGKALGEHEDEMTDAEVVALMQSNPPDALFFTHIHGDHIGLLHEVPDCVQIYMGRISLLAQKNLLQGILQVPNLSSATVERCKKQLAILNDGSRVHFISQGDMVHIGRIIVRPISCDHSCCDSYMLLFQCGHQTILHTGDYRMHGRLGKPFWGKLRSVISYKKVEVVITEGTSLHGQQHNSSAMSETELEKSAYQLMKTNPNIFLACSSLNIESLYSFYRAMLFAGKWRWLNNGKKQECKPALIANGYVKQQLDLFTEEYAKGRDGVKINFHRSYRMSWGLQRVLKNDSTQEEQMVDNGFVMLVSPYEEYRKLMEQLSTRIQASGGVPPVLVYSQWDGYLEPGQTYTNQPMIDMVNWWEQKGLQCVHLHTSGHAEPENVGKLIYAVRPKRVEVVHTASRE